MTTYTAAQTAHIAVLAQDIEDHAVRMAVVDYLGFSTQLRTGRVVKISETSPLSVRFGVRSEAHVASYAFPAIRMNRAMRDEASKAYCALMQSTYPEIAGEFPIL